MAAADCVTLWVGDALGPVERACLRSVVRTGHRLALYCYSTPAGVPDGVELREASAILPHSAVTALGRPDLYSDWFRYELLDRGLGTWLDTDVYVLGTIDGDRPYLFGEQAPGVFNNAVLRLPAASPVVAELLEPFREQTTPRWLPRRTYWPLRIRELLTGRADLTHTPWGTTSPHALTALAGRHGLRRHAQPQEAFYPVPWQKADWILDPGVTLEAVTGEETVAVHLWNERIKAFKGDSAPAGSFLARLQEEGRL